MQNEDTNNPPCVPGHESGDRREAAPQLDDGIYFGIPDEVYFAQDALGSTDQKQIVLDAIEWQFDRLHGEDTDSAAKIFGSALHCRVLEGKEAFDVRYGVAPDPSDFEDLITTADSAKAWLDKEGAEYRKSAKKPDLIALVRALDEDAVIWDDVVAAFNDKYPEGRRIDAKILKKIETACEWLQATEKLAPIMSGGSLTLGAPELTILYHRHGVRCRARIDYLYPGLMIDMKTYRPWRNAGEPLATITQTIANWRYDLQYAAYMDAIEEARNLFVDGKVFGDEPSPGFLELVFSDQYFPPKWLWLMIKNDGAPRPSIAEFPHDIIPAQTARDQIEHALMTTFKNLNEKFGPDVDWRQDEPVYVLAAEDFPAWFGRT